MRSPSACGDLMEPTRDDALPLERPSFGSPLLNVQESAARYAFAASEVRGMRVLDVASGAGLGSAFLLDEGARVAVGVEFDAEALSRDGVAGFPAGPHFVRADALALPFQDASFDVVVSFETIEHVVDARRMLAECRRLLRPGGRLCLSTPNRSVTRWLPRNPFHVREFTAAEIVALVRDQFHTVTRYGQRPVFLPVFVLRQVARGALAGLPGGDLVWRLWKRIRPARTQRGATVWRGRRFDASLLQDRHYEVAPAARTSWWHPMFTVLVARC